MSTPQDISIEQIYKMVADLQRDVALTKKISY